MDSLDLMKWFEKETGQKAIIDCHCRKVVNPIYITWLERKLTEAQEKLKTQT